MNATHDEELKDLEALQRGLGEAITDILGPVEKPLVEKVLQQNGRAADFMQIDHRTRPARGKTREDRSLPQERLHISQREVDLLRVQQGRADPPGCERRMNSRPCG